MGQLLKGKTVIVTGAGGGIGFATATRAYDEGARVVATAHSEAGPHLLSDMSTAITGTAFVVVDGGVLAGA